MAIVFHKSRSSGFGTPAESFRHKTFLGNEIEAPTGLPDFTSPEPDSPFGLRSGFPSLEPSLGVDTNLNVAKGDKGFLDLQSEFNKGEPGLQDKSAGFERAQKALGGAQIGLAIGGAIAEANFARVQGDLENALEQHSARLFELNIEDAYQRATEKKQKIKFAARKLKSDRTVAFAGQNVLLGLGTPEQLDISDDEMTARELDAIDQARTREIQFFERQQLAAQQRGEMAKLRAKFRRQAALVKGASKAVSAGAALAAGS